MIAEYTDLQLVNNLKNNVDEENSLKTLVDRHSGIYLDMINSYSSPDNPYIDYHELIQDKEYKIYDAALKFDETKGAKFSTYLGNETKWMCLNTYNRNKRRPVFNSEYIENMKKDNDEEMECDTISDSIRNDLFRKVLNVIERHPDERVEKIFKMRYIVGTKNKVMPWKQIGDSMNLSIQGCINIHNSAIETFKNELRQDI
ncbi:MAG: sigma-70 family RNA polymerase sigma factor [Flavobacteriia bacterium]|nr:sigma-70 family RNA polymerase sigma factor [Flavobacteriia bacterium]